MEMEIIGKENLPNTYVDRIRILESNSGHKLSIDITIYDHKINKSWFGRINDLKIKVCLVSSASKYLAIVDGMDGIYNDDRIDQKMILSPSSGEFIESEYNGMSKYTKTIVFENIPQAIWDLSIFSSCYIDNLGFENDLFNRYYGPLTGERIFVAGQPNQSSGRFVYSDTGEEYFGPVHQKPDGSYMEGSFHSNEPHRDLTYVTEQNFKVSSDEILGIEQEVESMTFAEEFIAPSNTGRVSGKTFVTQSTKDTLNASVTPPPGY